MQKKPLTSNAKIFLFSAIVLSIAISWLVAYAISLRVEFETKRTVDQAIPVQDMGWVRPQIDGAVVTLTGEAPDDTARFRVVEAVSSEINVNRIDDEIATPEVNIDGPELSVEIVQNSHMSSIIGLLPKEPSPVELYYALDRANPTVETLNLVETLEAQVDESWANKLEYIVFIIENVSNAQISANEDEVVVETVVPDDEAASLLRQKLSDKIPADYKAELNISAPRPLVAPFVFQETTADGEVEINRCAATDDEDLQKIRDGFEDLADAQFESCQLGLGAPTEDWGLLVSQLTSETAALSDHSLTIKDNAVHLDYADSLDEELVNKVSSRIRASLPPGFSFDSQRIVQVKTIEELQEDGNEIVFDVKKDINGQGSIAGVLGSEAMKTNVQSIAVAKFGSGEISYELDLVDGLPATWEKAVYTMVNAVSTLTEGEAILTTEFLSIKGTAPDDETKALIMDSLSNELGELTVQDEVTVSEHAVAAAESNPLECVDRINATLLESPIQFEPSSSRISEGSQKTITEIAQILYECRASSFEIGGHTDSKGGEEVNLRISQQRAEAVLDAVMATALEFGTLTAKGYGESEPIASNDTEEGRAQNRRIEIRLNVE